MIKKIKNCKWCNEEFTGSSKKLYCTDNIHYAHCELCGRKYELKSRRIVLKNSRALCLKCTKKESTRKAKNTKEQLYGDPNFNNRKKAKSTMTQRYGGETTLESPALKKQFHKTMIELYGSPIIKGSSREDINSASKRANAQNISIEDSLFITKLFNNGEMLENFLYELTGQLGRMATLNDISDKISCSPTEASHIFSQRFPKLKQKFITVRDSYWELRVIDFLSEFDINYLRRVRILEGGLEIDIFIPEKRIGFEINDFGSHSRHSDNEKSEWRFQESFKRGPTYHDKKFQTGLQKGIKILFIWEDEIRSNGYKNIVREALRL